MIYYRVASQIDETSATWKWKSTVLTSLDALFGYLKTFQAVPKDRMRVFLSSSAQQGWDEMHSPEQWAAVQLSFRTTGVEWVQDLPVGGDEAGVRTADRWRL